MCFPAIVFVFVLVGGENLSDILVSVIVGRGGERLRLEDIPISRVWACEKLEKSYTNPRC